ncbi:MAG: hypothetical protein HYU36_23085 [Planctomycetes bacterium]|nr:hypothetical protein [Planctomycetota bacterium]
MKPPHSLSAGPECRIASAGRLAVLVLTLAALPRMPSIAEGFLRGEEGIGALRSRRRTLAATDTEEAVLKHDGLTRRFRLHLPAGVAERPLPLIISLHGASANGKIQELLTGFSAWSDRNGFAVAYPDGENGIWQYWGADVGTENPFPLLKKRMVDDAGFILALVDELAGKKIADPKRVFVNGMSNGAYLSQRLGWNYTDRFAGMAAVAGTMFRPVAQRVKPKAFLPMLYFHGTADPLVGYDGSDFITHREASLSAEEMAAWWARHNRCQPQPVVEKLPDAADDGLSVERYSYTPAGPEGAPVTFYKIIGGGHTWPGGSVQPERMLGKTSRDIRATDLMGEFFAGLKR